MADPEVTDEELEGTEEEEESEFEAAFDPEEEEEMEEQTQSPPIGKAKTKIQIEGDPDAVQQATQQLRQPEPAPSQPSPDELESQFEMEDQREQDARQREFMKHLLNPKNMVVVRRMLPRRWQGAKCAGEVARYECPASMDDIAEDVFERFGGKKFKVSVHTSSAAGTGKLLAAEVIENPEIDEPYFEGEPPMAGLPPRMPGGFAADDPTLMPDDDPVAIAEQTLRDRTKVAAQKIKLRDLERTLKEMEEEANGGPQKRDEHDRPRDNEQDNRIAELQRKIELQGISNQHNLQISAMKSEIEKLSSSMNQPRKEDNSLGIIAQMMQASQKQSMEMMQLISQGQQQTTQHMMTMMTQSMQRPNIEEKFEDRIAQLASLKSVLGTDDSKTKKFDDLMMDIVMEKIHGGGGPQEEEDVLKFAIKEITPILKSMVQNEQNKSGREMTVEEKQAAYTEAAAQVKADILQRIEQQKLEARPANPALPTQRPAQPAPTPAPAPARAPEKTLAQEQTTEVEIKPLDFTTAPAKAAAPMPAGNAPVQPAPPITAPVDTATAPSDHEHSAPILEPQPDDGKVPAGPTSDAYNRETSVTFILENLLEEIEDRVPWDRPNESFLPSDCLNLLDDELLTSLQGITNGPQLETWLSPHAPPDLIVEIKRVGNDQTVKDWVARIISTVKHAYHDQVKNTQNVSAKVGGEPPQPEDQTKAEEMKPPADQVPQPPEI